MLNKLKTFLSKKLLVAILSAAIIWANNKWQLGMSEQTISNIVIVIVGYIIGQAAVDIAAVRTPGAPNPPSIGNDYPHGDGSVVFAPPNMNNM